MTQQILGFFGEYRYLSNFYEAPVEYEAMPFSSSEAAYQAAKTTKMSQRVPFTTAKYQEDWDKSLRLLHDAVIDPNKQYKTPTPNRTKKMGKGLTLRPDWEIVKYEVMYQIVKDKFTRNQYLAGKLLSTGDAYLEETNTWGDKCWGVCNGEGQNHLGKILMKVREELNAHRPA